MKAKLIFSALVAVAVMGCNKIENTPAPEYITVSTDILSKVSTNADGSQIFTAGDKISVYAWTGDAASVPAVRVVDNAINTLGTDGVWTAAPQMLWKNLVDKHYFVGVYPSHAASEADLSAVKVSVDPADQLGSDVLVATELSGKIAENNPVKLNFSHLMAKVSIELSYRNQWGGGAPEVSAVKIKNLVSSATLDLLTMTITADASPKSDTTIPEFKENEIYGSVLVPQNGITTIAITIDGSDYIYTHPSDIKFETGKVTTIRLIVGRNQVDLADVTIQDWAAGDTISGGEALN
ncbi:MAG: fimbrillin family protein [Bacteroidales bacterium]|nr:fimbrillin family protein [Bacteroidales bacterium]